MEQLRVENQIKTTMNPRFERLGQLIWGVAGLPASRLALLIEVSNWLERTGDDGIGNSESQLRAFLVEKPATGCEPNPPPPRPIPVELTREEITQLEGTIELYEAMTQTVTGDYQALDILKECYLKLGDEAKALATSRKLARVYLWLGQEENARCECGAILRKCPEDEETLKLLREITEKPTDQFVS